MVIEERETSDQLRRALERTQSENADLRAQLERIESANNVVIRIYERQLNEMTLRATIAERKNVLASTQTVRT